MLSFKVALYNIIHNTLSARFYSNKGKIILLSYFSYIKSLLKCQISQNLSFVALDISGKNYLSWILDAEIHLTSLNLGETIKKGNEESQQDCAKALILLRHHLHEDLKNEYLTVKDLFTLWNYLKDIFDHQKTVILPKARYNWMHLRLQDFRTVSEYNSTLFKISFRLKLCGKKITDEDMLEKTFTTFHASNVLQ